MKPKTPKGKAEVREYADRAAARPAGAPPTKSHDDARGPTLCPACAESVEKGTTLGAYDTAQPDLLQSWIAARHVGLPFDVRWHRGCIENAERDMQREQIRIDGDRMYYVDISMTTEPILPTPIRMRADLRFTGQGVTMAFVDSGFWPHDDLLDGGRRIVAWYDAVRGREITSVARRRSVPPRVEMWHGTMASSTAAGSGHRSGGEYRGIASDARLVLVSTMTPKYRIQTPQVVRALRWIRDNRERLDVRVVNLSLGVDETAESLFHPVIDLVEELVRAGVVIVAASGNNPMNPIKPPGASPNAITVGGYNDNNSSDWMRREMWHSSYIHALGGGPKPELLGPSIFIAAPILPRTAVKQEAEVLFTMACASDNELKQLVDERADETGIALELRSAQRPIHMRSIVLERMRSEKLITPDYKHVDGTSFSAPIVASVAAQILEARPELSPHEVKEILCKTAVLLKNVPDEVQGYGIVNPESALAVAVAGGAPERPYSE